MLMKVLRNCKAATRPWMALITLKMRLIEGKIEGRGLTGGMGKGPSPRLQGPCQGSSIIMGIPDLNYGGWKLGGVQGGEDRGVK